jgi:hypothetical protein
MTPSGGSRFLAIFLSVVTLFVIAAIGVRVWSYNAGDGVRLGEDAPSSTAGDTTGTLTLRDDATPAADTAESVDGGTIVEIGETAPARTATSREEERRRLFDRLLTERPVKASPAAVTAEAAPVRVVALPPPPAPKPAPVRAAAPPAPRPAVVSMSSGGATQSTGPVPGEKPAQQTPDDPNSDNTPPQVQLVEFNPQQVRDGEVTVLTITAMDNLSGVRSISGTIVSPTGALTGFACQREPDTNRFSTRVAVPKDAAEGTWNVSYISLSDNASNSTQVTYVPPNVPAGASFRVTSSRPDSAGPSLKAVWLDKPSIRAGEKTTVSVQADDDKAGVKVVSGIFVSPSKHARIGFNCQPGDGLNWRCGFNPPACLDCGTWQLEQMQLQDNANNTTTIRGDNPIVSAVKIDIFGDNCDSTTPTMQTIALDRNSISNATATSITVTVVASDNLCGVGSVSGHATGPSRPGSVSRVYFALNPSGDGQSWSGPMNIPEKAPKGVWTVTWVQVLDKGFNLKAYAQGDPILGTATFRVE